MKTLFFVALMALMGLQASAQEANVSKALFCQGDDMNWAKPDADDTSWSEIDITKPWDKQGFPPNNNAYGWYRIHMTIPRTLMNGADQQNVIVFHMPKADDVDECYLNGRLIGSTGRMPTDPAGYFCGVNLIRDYLVDARTGGIRWDAENVIAVRVYNRGGSGGLFWRPMTLRCPSAAEGIAMQLTEENSGSTHCDIEISSAYASATSGTFAVTLSDRETGTEITSLTKKLSIKRNKPARVTIPYDKHRMCLLTATYIDAKTGKVLSESRQLKYILTPAAPATPRFNNAPLFGVRPGSPVIYRFAVSGERPMKFTCDNLPAGLQLSESEGALSGNIDKPCELTFTVTAENARGRTSQEFTLKVGEHMIGLTPPMGWNSWNCWGLSVSQEKVMSSTQALIDKGLARYSSVGHWNDPDMLVVGKVGWGSYLRETRLTPDEQYTHITLWTLLASNMLIGCDIAQMDDFTLNLLCNNEVNAVNQDILGQQADRVRKEGDIEVWSRPLADGAIAVGIFNLGDQKQQVDMKTLIPAQKPAKTVRDLWRQKDLSASELSCTLPAHGCRYLKVVL